jgi:threonine aldolase
MYEYAVQASLGDDVYHEPNTAALEAHMARIFGKEAAVFVPSGTMANQLAVRSHLKQPPYSILCDHRAHIYECEAGGLALHSGAHVIPVIPSNGRRPLLCRPHEHQLTPVQKDITLPSKTFPTLSS